MPHAFFGQIFPDWVSSILWYQEVQGNEILMKYSVGIIIIRHNNVHWLTEGCFFSSICSPAAAVFSSTESQQFPESKHSDCKAAPSLPIVWAHNIFMSSNLQSINYSMGSLIESVSYEEKRGTLWPWIVCLFKFLKYYAISIIW